MRNIVSRLFLFPLCALLWGVVASGCSDEEDGLQPGKYGYVQFKLYKLASYDKDTGGGTTQRQTSQAVTPAGAGKLGGLREMGDEPPYGGTSLTQTPIPKSFN